MDLRFLGDQHNSWTEADPLKELPGSAEWNAGKQEAEAPPATLAVGTSKPRGRDQQTPR